MSSPDRSTAIKKIQRILRSSDRHWVGDGFPVRTLFSYASMGAALSPFLLLDYVEPATFAPTGERRGVGEHPHRGFETVTIVYTGEVEHRDSSGGGGKIGPGDVQWMTAGAGIVHEEFHGRDYAARGGGFEMVQLWVNLPAKHKLTAPRYQGILDSDIPTVALPAGNGSVRIIAGSFKNVAGATVTGPAKTFTPIHLWDLRLAAARSIDLDVPDGYTTALVLLSGSLRLNGADALAPAELALFERAGARIHIDTVTEVKALLLCGEPIAEPIAGMGPFVMNTKAEIQQAVTDYQNGKMGHL